MANEKNLISNNQRTPNERRANAKKAGKASGKARRAKKAMREYAEMLLALPVSDMRRWNKLARLGVAPKDCDNKMLVMAALMQAAQAGDVQAEKELRSVIGEDQVNAADAGQLEQLIKGLQQKDG